MEFEREPGSDVVLVRKAFSPEQQLVLLQELLACEQTYNAEKVGNSERVVSKAGHRFERLFGISVDWMQKPGRPPCQSIASVPERLCPQVAALSQNLTPARYPVSFVDCFRYGPDGCLAGHVDCIFGWVIVVSLGCDAVFWYEEPEDRRSNNIFAVRDATRRPRQRFLLHSGDAIFFDGGIGANVLHGVESVVMDSAPEFFPEEHRGWRYCLQYRQGRDEVQMVDSDVQQGRSGSNS